MPKHNYKFIHLYCNRKYEILIGVSVSAKYFYAVRKYILFSRQQKGKYRKWQLLGSTLIGTKKYIIRTICCLNI